MPAFWGMMLAPPAAVAQALTGITSDFGADYGGKSFGGLGSGFTSFGGVTNVLVNGIAASSFSVTDDHNLTFVQPPDTANTTPRDVVVTWASGSATLAGALTVFSPFVNVSGLQAGYRYENATTTGGSPNKVSSWTDQSGNGNHLIQATGAQQPQYVTGVIGGHAALRFSGGQLLATTANVTTSAGAFSILLSCAPSGTAGVIYEQSVNVLSNPGLWMYGSNLYSIFRNGSGGSTSEKDVSANWAVGGTWKSLAHVCDGTHAGHLLYSSNTSVALTNGALTANPGAGSVADKIYFGARSSLSLPSTMDVVDFLIFDRVLSATERARADEWLRGRVGL